MIKIFSSIKAKLAVIISIIIALFIVSFVMVYNSRYFTNDIIEQSAHLKNLRLYPEECSNQFSVFLQKEIFDINLYQNEKSTALDSLVNIKKHFIKQLDTLFTVSYIRAKLPISLAKGLKLELNKFTKGNELLFSEIVKRGFQQSGRAGDWNRQGEFLENYISTLKNPVLLKSWIDIRKKEFRYNLAHSSNIFDNLTDETLHLKSVLTSGESNEVRGIGSFERQRLMAELDKYAELAIAVRNLDKAIGLGTDNGIIGSQMLELSIIHDKADTLANNIQEQIHGFTTWQFILRVIVLLLLAALATLTISAYYKNIEHSLQVINAYFSELVKGRLPEPAMIQSKDELHQLTALISEFVLSLRAKVKFAQHLGKGTNNQELVPLSKEDTLANALLDLQVSLKKAAEEDTKYKIEEKKRAWSNEGLAKFSEILRFQTSDISELSDLIIINLVKYLNANQGGIFAYVDDDPQDIHLNLVSAFAYDRKKHLQKRIEIGEGLVGTCAQERLTVFMTDIPEEYISVTSGLGDAPPRCLLLVPLKTEENIYGILEIASFNIFEPHEIEFVEKLAESIASTFYSLKINVHTSKLLEQSKKQAEEMSQQEEEMRQNLEELQATQEESARREAETLSILSAIDTSAMVMELDLDGKIIEINRKYCSALNCHREDIFGKNLRAICNFAQQSEDYNFLMAELRNGRSHIRREEIYFNNKKFFFTQNYSPIFDQNRNPYKVLVIATNDTEYIQLENNLSELDSKLEFRDKTITNLNEVIDKSLIFAELNADGTILKANKNYQEVTGYLEEEILNKNARYFLKEEELRQFEMIWGEVEKGKSHNGVVRRTKPTGEECWLMSSLVPLRDERGLIQKVFFLAQDITEKKLKYKVLDEANKEIERLKSLYENNNKDQV